MKKERNNLITRDLLKEEIDKVQDSYLNVLYRIIKALENHPNSEDFHPLEVSDWKKFIDATYGCMADDQIDRGKQGRYEVREVIK
jgi:hypothetical protein